MPSIEILGTGWIDQRDSAFPQSVQLLRQAPERRREAPSFLQTVVRTVHDKRFDC